MSAGYGIEVDVQPSSDGSAMVFHDDTLDRMTDAVGPVRFLDAEALSAIRLLDSSDTIPTLQEILDVIDGQVPLVIEIKDQSGAFGQTDGILEAAVARDILHYAGPITVM